MTAKAKEKRVAYHGFTTDELGLDKAICGYECFNCDCRGGRLTTAVGIEFVQDALGKDVVLPNVKKIQRFFQGFVKTGDETLEKVYFLVVEAGTYMFQTGKGWVLLGEIAPFDCITTREESGEVWNVLLTETNVYVVKTFGVLQKCLSMVCLAGCLSGERMFYGTQGGTVVYSKPGEPTLVSDSMIDGGKLCLPADAGEIMAMKALGKRVYVFCEHAIYKLETKANAGEFVVRRVPYEGGRIVKNGVGVLGETMVVLAENGAYLLKNDALEKGYERLRFGRIEPYSVQYGCFEGKVTFTYYERQELNRVRRAVTLYSDGKYGFFGDALEGLSGGEQGVFFLRGVSRIGTLGGVHNMYNLPPTFRARTMDLGVNGRKNLKKIRLYGEGQVRVRVESEQGAREYFLLFKNGVAETRLVESGFAFAFSFMPNIGSIVDGADIEFLYAEE